ncbi:hypothetical protein O7630_30660 [Micromonospora sp. WMMD718]|uniref:hypothetical protein n=1 Tax=unclassified Micromonospora TaxID=2617518 RepID=UPI000B114D0C|nr:MULTISPECIES: hypothetical protein [unclassified Micromonospora]MDG4755307.1 hypothetical protein [Micromonospora sp. WMMD718]
MIALPDGYTWAEPLNAGVPLDLDRRKHGDQWIDFVFRRLADSSGATGHQMASHDTFPGGYICQPTGTRIQSALWLLFLVDQGPICVVIGRDSPRDDDIEPWRDAVAHALGQIGTVTEFGWWAIIGPDPNSSGGGIRLVPPREVGSLKLDAAPDVFVENVPARFNLFSARSCRTGLVKVRGTSTGYTWGVAAEDAARRLRLLCAMLSIAGESWVQRCSVNPLINMNEAGEAEPTSGDEIELPVKSPWDRDDLISMEDISEMTTMETPDWIVSRWDAIASDAGLQDVLVNYHEGLLMMPDHPSYAALAFVAVIEALGNRTVGKLPRCDQCKVVTGSGQRFRQALTRVLPAEEAEYFGRRFYDRRSRTAHEGVLHGAEPIFGAWSHWGGISDNQIRDFEILLRNLSTVARRLLLLEAGQVEVPKSSLLWPALISSGLTDLASPAADGGETPTSGDQEPDVDARCDKRQL